MYIKMVAPADIPPSHRRLSAEDWMLLDSLGSHGTPCTGRFLTMHKRRRKKLVTRNLQQDVAILDDVHHGQVQCILDQCGRWGFNAFALEASAGGRSLPVLCVHLFHWYGLLEHFRLDVVRVWKLFTLIEEGYHSTNPYHNSIHATDVTQAMHCFLQEEKIRKHMSPLEVMASLIGAVAHDLDHPGVNQHFLISTSNHLAALYENMSVLENHHWRSAVGCLLESGVAEQLTAQNCRAELEEQIRSLILATDITRQNEFLMRFKKDLDEESLKLNRFEDRHFILQIALKCADISNPTRPWDISHKWSLKVCQEFFRQGDFERKLNLPVTSLCDRQSTSVPKIQSGFFRFVVTPLFTEWHRFLSSELSTHMMEALADNHKRWEKMEAAEQAEETHTELSDAEPEEISEADEETRGSSETLLLPVDFIPRRQSLAVPKLNSSINSRRHSMPVNTGPVLPRTIIRRESLPPSRFLHDDRLPCSRASSGHIREEDELRFGSQSSLLSSNSGGNPHSGEENPERPLSAETLLPEPTIASITSSAAVDQLNSVLHGFTVAPPSKCLTRQQTFPPLQPYVRMRYMSTTAEMSSCAEALLEGGSNSNSSHSSQEIMDKPITPVPTITILSPNNGRSGESMATELQTKNVTTSYKREPEALEKEKATKIARLSDSDQHYEKENVDPRRFVPPSLNIRRGSAPVTASLIRPDENAPSAGGVLRATGVMLPRRGSMPADVSQHTTTEKEPHSETRNISNVIPPQFESYLLRQCPRRGSAPTVSPITLTLPIERRDVLTRHTSLNGKASRRKKQLRRRSSGGPETVCSKEVIMQETFHRLRREFSRKTENPDTLLARRRGSLPIEMLTVGHSVC